MADKNLTDQTSIENVRLLKPIDESAARSSNPISYLTNDDIKAIERRLERAMNAMRSVHMIAENILNDLAADDMLEGLVLAIGEVARANERGLNACIGKLTGASVIHEDEFETA